MNDSTNTRRTSGGSSHHRSGTNKRQKQSSLLTSYFQPLTTSKSEAPAPLPVVRSVPSAAPLHLDPLPPLHDSSDDESGDDSLCLAELIRTQRTKKAAMLESKGTKATDRTKGTNKLSTGSSTHSSTLALAKQTCPATFSAPIPGAQGTNPSSTRLCSNESLSLSDFGVYAATEMAKASRKGPPRKRKPPPRSTGAPKSKRDTKVALKGSNAALNVNEAVETEIKPVDKDTELKRTGPTKWSSLDQSRNIVHAIVLSTYNSTSFRRGQRLGTRFAVADPKGTRNKHRKASDLDTRHDAVSTESLRDKLARFPAPWAVVPGLHLVQHADLSGNLGTVSKIAWDCTGELLAVAYDGSSVSSGHAVVAIYNWDTVVAAHFHSRRRRQQSLPGGTNRTIPAAALHTVGPVLTIPIPTRTKSSVAVLEWNPFNADELVVGVRSSESIFLFDLGEVGDWLEDYAKNGRLERDTFPPCVQLQCSARSDQSPVINCDSSFRFVGNGDQALLTAGTEVVCWKIGCAQRERGIATPFWKFRYKDTITCLETLGSETVILGTCIGRLAVLNWRALVRVSFSNSPSPTLVEDWTSYSTGPGQTPMEIPSPVAMGIRRMFIQKTKLPNSNVQVALVWATACGWVLSSSLEMYMSGVPSHESGQRLQRVQGCEICIRTKPVQWVNQSGDKVDRVASKVWVVPSRRIPTAVTDTSLLWQKVHDSVTQLVPSSDQRVLHSDPVIDNTSDEQPAIQYMPLSQWRGHSRSVEPVFVTVPLCERAGPPTTLSAHPTHEWIAVGTVRRGVYLVHSTTEIRN